MPHYQPLRYDPQRARRGHLDHLLHKSGVVEDYDEPLRFNRIYQDSRNAIAEPAGTRGHKSREARHSAKEKNNGMPLGKALKKLHREVGTSEEFHDNFLRTFENDIDRVKNYCPKDLLHSIWVLRIKGERSEQDDGGQDEDISDTKERFELRKNQITQALAEASKSSLKDFKGTRLASAERLKEKVDTYMSQILKLLNLAPKAREHCSALVDTLKELKDLIDPEVEKNKELMTGSSEDEDGDGSGSDGGDDGSIDGSWS